MTFHQLASSGHIGREEAGDSIGVLFPGTATLKRFQLSAR